MSNLNLRIYADQFYGLYIPKLNNYISQQIDKDSFISSFKSGFLTYNNITTKTKINLNPTIILESVNINTINIKIPDEKTDLIIDTENIKINLLLSEINDNDLQELIIKEKNELKEKFIENIFNKITNKSKNNFFGGILNGIINKVLSGLHVIMKNVELNIKFKNFIFIINFGNIEFNLKDIISNIIFKDIKISYKDIENKGEENIINQTEINMSIDFKDEEENNNGNITKNSFTKFKIGINNIKFNLSVKIINAIFDVIKLLDGLGKNKFEFRIKKLIQFHKPKNKDKNYYKLLWQYSIRAVIKLRKFVCFDNNNILEISNFIQNKLLQNGEKENLILVNDINLLKSTKHLIEKKILDSKDSLANKFFSFFSSNNNNPKSLTEEEKNLIETYLKEENIIKYLKGELFSEENDDNKSNQNLQKYMSYLNCIDGSIDVNNFEMVFNTNLDLKNNNLYLKKIDFNFGYKNKNFNFKLNIFEDSSVNKENSNDNIISINYDNSDKINIIINKDNFEITEDKYFLIICYSLFIFGKISEKSQNFNSNKNEKNNEFKYESILNKIYLPFWPSLSLKMNNGNKIDFVISNFHWNEKLITFQSQIKESSCSILDVYKFDIDITKGFSIDLEKPLTIYINKALIKELIENFKNVNNDIYSERKPEQKLFNFNYSKNLNKIELFKYININIKEFDFIINDFDDQSSIILKDFQFLLDNKNLSLSLNEIFSEIDLLSLSPIIDDIKKIKYNITSDNNNSYKYYFIELIKSFKLKLNHINFYLYISHKSTYINSIINNINIQNELQNIYVINSIFNDVKIKYIDISIPNNTRFFDSKKIESNMRINGFNNYAATTNIESPMINMSLLLSKYNEIQKYTKYFIEGDNIYEININNLKCEYIKNTSNSGLSIYITNFIKKKENSDIDLLYLEKYNLNYKLDSYDDLLLKISSENLEGGISQRDISYIFFILFFQEQKKLNEENYFNLINNLYIDINLNKVKWDFNLSIDDEKPLFNLYFGHISIKLSSLKNNMNNIVFLFDQFQVNYYGINNNNFFIENKKSIAILNCDMEEKNNSQIEINKDICNKYIININKINFIFNIDIILSIINYFKDISIFDFLVNYKENNSSNEKSIFNNLDIQIIISELEILFPKNKNYLSLMLNKLDFNYLKEEKSGVKVYQAKLSLNNIDAKYLNRKILYTKNDYLLFVLDIKNSKKISMLCNSLFNKLIIKISYLDFIFIYKIILDINRLFKSFKKETNELLQKENEITEDSKNKDVPKFITKFVNFSEIKSIISEINIEGIDITFLEEDTNYIDIKSNHKYYCPFFKIGLNKSFMKYEFVKDIEELYPNINFNSQWDLSINYLNYNNKIWEPLTEDLIIKIDYENKTESNKLFDNYTLEINKLIVNLSDTFINILLIKIFRYYNKFKNNINENKSDEKALNEIILKYKICNYTDIDFEMNYMNKTYQIKKSEKIYIDFDSEENQDKNNNINNIIILTEKNNQKKILILPENIGIKKYRIDCGDIEKNVYIETKIREHKHIEIMIYNSIIIKNKTDYTFNITFDENKKQTNLINLESNSFFSFHELLHKNEFINIHLNLDNKEDIVKLNLNEIIPKSPANKISKDILFKNNSIFFSLISKVKSEDCLCLKIIYKYYIINCLPCSLFISKNINQVNKDDNDEIIEIKKNSLFNIDNASIFTQSNSIFLKIKIQGQFYISKLSLMRNDTKTKLINFVNSSNDKQITLQIIIKESYKNKAMILYSENILYNKSGIGLNIFTQYENNHNHIHDLGKNIYLISSDIKKSKSFIGIKSSKNIFIPKYIKYEDFIKLVNQGFSLNFEGKKDIYNFELIIEKELSNLWCENDKNNFLNKIEEKNGNKTTIYTILPKYNIINFCENKTNTNMNIVLKSTQKYFLGIDIKNMEDIKDRNNYYLFDNLHVNPSHTICLKGNIYNIEIKKAEKGGYKNIFVFNNNLKNSQVIVENKSNYEIIIKQKSFEKFKQKIKKYEKQILKIYDQTNRNFSAEIDNKLYYFNLNETGQKLLIKNLYLYIEKEKVDIKVVFQEKSTNKNLFPKSKSEMNIIQPNFINLKFNFNRDKYVKINILLNHINISIISQNKLERKEIILLFINDFQCGMKLLKSKKQNKYKIKLNTKISSLESYNLLNNTNTTLITNTSSPLINIYSELIYELDKNKITVFELINAIGNIKCNITPGFLQEIYNFVQNIYENTDIYMKNINKIFLLKNLDNLNKTNMNNNYINNYQENPLSIIINKIAISGVKILFKLKKEGMETLPNTILDSINYFKCFPFFELGRETKAILKKIELQGPFKDIKSLYEEIKINIITQLSTEIVIKVLHPSNNDIKENMKDMIGFDSSKTKPKINLENSSRIKNKRIFIGKNKFYKKYDKIISIVEQGLKNMNTENFNDKFCLDTFSNFNDENNVIIFFEDCFVFANDNGQNIKIIFYQNLKEIKKEKVNKKFFVDIKYVNNKDDKDILQIVINFKNDIFAEQIYKLLCNFSDF